MHGPAPNTAHAQLMDANYRLQRHIYDITRKYYLLGRDYLIGQLVPGKGARILELGCGTARNLIVAARRWPDAHFTGLDISAAMLETAQKNIEHAGLSGRIRLVRGDAAMAGELVTPHGAGFDRVFCAYCLSMIPDWQGAMASALRACNQGGTVHLVDFGDQHGLPGWFRKGLYAWLARYHVTPRLEMADQAEALAQADGGMVKTRSLYRGYAQYHYIMRGGTSLI